MPSPIAPLLKRPWTTLILLFSGSSGESDLAELHVGARAFRTPVILVDAAAEEDHAEPFREHGGGPVVAALGGERFEPGQRHGDPGAAKDGAAGNLVERRGWSFSFAFLLHCLCRETIG